MDLAELLDLITRYELWIYGVLLAYCLGKTGPLPMLAGYAASMGALQFEALLLVTLLGSVLGGQLRFALGRYASPWVCSTFTTTAPWIALASAGVERYSLRVHLSYRFVKGTFSLVGLGAGASLLSWRQFSLVDGAGALLWVGSFVCIGWSFGNLGATLDPKWAAYVGLALLLVSIVSLATFGKALKKRLRPIAENILRERTAQAQ